MIELGPVRLRPIEGRDLPAIQRVRNDPATTGTLGGFSSGYSLRDLEEWLDTHRRREHEVLWAVAAATDDEAIGHAGLYNIDHRVGKAEYGIALAASRTGRGLGRVVTNAVLRFAFDELNLRRVSLTVLATNERAIRLYRGAGFVEEGRLREDQYRFGQYIDVVAMALLHVHWDAAQSELTGAR